MQIKIPISLDAPGVLPHYDALRLLRQFTDVAALAVRQRSEAIDVVLGILHRAFDVGSEHRGPCYVTMAAANDRLRRARKVQPKPARVAA
jgi:hypothetical protein